MTGGGRERAEGGRRGVRATGEVEEGEGGLSLFLSFCV